MVKVEQLNHLKLFYNINYNFNVHVSLPLEYHYPVINLLIF